MIMKENGEMDVVMGGKAHSMITDKKLSKEEIQKGVDSYNKVIDDYAKALDEKTKKDLNYASDISKRMETTDIIPINKYVLVQPYEKNPFEKVEVTKSGIVIPTYDGKFKNPDSGKDDVEEKFSVQALVIEASPECKYVKAGDVVYYRRPSAVPIPFFRQGLEVVAETSIQVVINEGLKERFKLKD